MKIESINLIMTTMEYYVDVDIDGNRIRYCVVVKKQANDSYFISEFFNISKTIRLKTSQRKIIRKTIENEIMNLLN